MHFTSKSCSLLFNISVCVNEYANVISNAITEQAALLNTSLKDNKQQRVHDSNTTGVVYLGWRGLYLV